MSKSSNTAFAIKLLDWHADIDRNLPWKASKDPYKIWLSEIIMQQTRVAQGTPYYLKFVKAFPTITDLANAEEAQVMKLWQGLGYYSRARNLHFAAKTVSDQYNGIFPTEYEDILALKGVGKYTAAAIASFAYDLEYPVVDGNVIRLLSRYFGITAPVDSSSTLKEINVLAQKLIKNSDPANFNQAIMDFGALMCSPKKPNCLKCPFQNECVAFASDLIDEIPFKSKKIKKKDRFIHYFIVTDDKDRVVLNFRDQKDIWKSLFDFPCIENQSKKVLEADVIIDHLRIAIGQKSYSIAQPTKVYKHVLSHQTIYGQFYEVGCKKLPNTVPGFTIANSDQLHSFAFPVLITRYFEEKDDLTLF